jgi:acyl dehydratase
MSPLPDMGVRLLLRALLQRPGPAARARPSAEHLWPGADPSHLARYREHLGFAADARPLSYLYLAAQRAQLAAMLVPGFGHRLAGMVHVANAMRWADATPPDPGRPMLLRTQVDPEPPRDDGALFLMLRVDFEQQGRTLAHCESRYLARRGTAGQRTPAQRERAIAPDGRPVADWQLPSDAGRRYAALSGDWNPIHLWPWSARPFGFRSPILHGMHSAARVEAECTRLAGRPPRALAIEFLRPVRLPGRVALHVDGSSGAFGLVAGAELVARGQCSG